MICGSVLPGALKSEDEHRRDICAVGRWIYERNYVASTDGNISVRLDQRHILTSPTGMCKGMMSPEDLVITDLDGKKVNGGRNASSELAMHLTIYRHRPEINSVCHAHPPVATGYAAAGTPLNKALVCELIISLGCIPALPARPNWPKASSPSSTVMTPSYWPIMAWSPTDTICSPLSSAWKQPSISPASRWSPN